MTIRSYQTGDEHAQARIYNTAAGVLPSFKPSTPKRSRGATSPPTPTPTTRYYAIENSEVVGYAAFGSNGRVSYPWCLPGAESHQEPLLETVLAAMQVRGVARGLGRLSKRLGSCSRFPPHGTDFTTSG